MDLTIPSHKLKTFTASLATLGRIGKDLYWSFDPLEGLTLSTLNDAKSAFCRFHFECGFFERCALLSGFRIGGNTSEIRRSRAAARSRRDVVDGNGNGNESEDERDGDGEEFETRYTCRVPLRAVHSIMRPSRKNVLSLRIRSEGRDAETGEYFGWTKNGGRRGAAGSPGGGSNGRRGGGRRGQKRKNRHLRQQQQEEEEEADEEEEEEEEEERNDWRKMSYSERRRRRKLHAKRGNHDHEHDKSDGEHNNETSDKHDSQTNNAKRQQNESHEDKMMLTFEFFIESPSRFKHSHKNSQTIPNTPNSTTIFRSLHKLAVTTTHGISLANKYSNSNSTYSSRSQIISHPKQWMRLLDPLQRTSQEVALRIDDELRVVTASSFHSGEYPAGVARGEGGSAGTRGENVLLLAAAARKAFLKTETSMNCQEFEEYDFRNNRGKRRKTRRRRRKRGERIGKSGGIERVGKGGNGSEGDTSTDEESDEEDDDDEFDFDREEDRPPPDVNQKVILVFSMKEAKAMFQFCNQAGNYSNAYDGDLLSVVSFHWGGRPLVIETDGEFYNAELVLATLHHGMIDSTVDVGGGDDHGHEIGNGGGGSARGGAASCDY